MTSEHLAPPARQRRAWPWVVLVLVVLLVAAAVAAEYLARSLVRDAVAGQLSTALEIEPSAVEVDLGDGILLAQLLRGEVAAAEVEVADLALGALEGDLVIAAEGIPLDAAQPTTSLLVSYAVPEDVLARVARDSTGIPLDGVTLEAPEIVATGQIPLLGNTLPLGLGITPGAESGALTFTPTSVRVGDDTFAVGELAGNPLFRGLAELVGAGFQVCVAEELPSALTLTDVAVDGSVLVAHFDGSGQALGGDAYRSRGSCG